jgi:integrase/recombinase XerD
MEAMGGSPITLQKYLPVVIRLCTLDPLLGSLAEITEDHVIELLRPFKSRSSARELYFHALKSFLTWAAPRGHVAADWTAGMKVAGPREKTPDAWAPEEIVALLEAASNTRHRAAILLGYSLGLRRTEVCTLTPDDIDWVNRRVRIRAEVAKGKRGRFVEMNDLAVEAIEALRPWKATLVDISAERFTMMVHDTAKRAGFPPGRRNSHMLRSSFATHLLTNGSPISVVSRLLGHANVATTSRYLAVTDSDRHAAVGRLGQALRGSAGQSESVSSI